MAFATALVPFAKFASFLSLCLAKRFLVDVMRQVGPRFRELYSASPKPSSKTEFPATRTKLTEHSNCGKLSVYSARFFSLRVANCPQEKRLLPVTG